MLRAVEVENADKAKPRILRYHEMPLPAGAARSGEVLEPQTVAAALRRLWSTGKFTSKNVVLGMGNQRVFARDVALPKAPLAQLRESLPFTVQDMLPMPVADAVMDFYPISDGVGDQGQPMINGLLVAAVKAAVLANVESVRLAGLNPVEVDLIPFALTRVLMRGIDTGGTVALIDVGATTTTVVMATRGVPLFVRIIPSGGEDVTKSLINRLNFSEQMATQAKQVLGMNKLQATPENAPVIDAIIETSVELLISLRNTIAYFDNTHEMSKVERIVLTGGGARLNGFAGALMEMTRVQTVFGNPFASVTAAKTVDQSPESLSMMVALGLALGSAA